MSVATKITLELAQEIVKDPQAIQRKYLSQEVLDLAYEIATEAKQNALKWIDGTEAFGKIDDLANHRQIAHCETIAQHLFDTNAV